MDPVSIAFANAQRGRQDLDRTYAQQSQAFGQVMQAANTFSSISDRAASREQQQKQFDATMEMRKQQMENGRELSRVELGIRQNMLAQDKIKLEAAQKDIAEAPEKEEAQAFAAKLARDAINLNRPPAETRAFVIEGFNGYKGSKYISPIEQAGILASVSSIASKTQLGLAQESYNQNVEQTKTVMLKYNLDPTTFTNPETGAFDMGGALNTLAEAERWKKAQDEQAATANTEQQAYARTSGQMKAYKDYGMGAGGKRYTDGDGKPIDEMGKITQGQAAYLEKGYYADAQKALSPEEKQFLLERSAYYGALAQGKTPEQSGTKSPAAPAPAAKGTVPQSMFPVK